MGNSSPSGSIPGSPNVSVSPSEPTPKLVPLSSSSPEVAYNSEDEYEARPHSQLSEEEWVEVRESLLKG